MGRDRQHSTPLVLSSTRPDAEVNWLQRITLARAGANGSRYDEGWVQRLIHHHPGLLPIEELEPDLVPARPVCMELPTPAGPADNLFVTPRGGLVLAECKLWRNPEARRQVVTQVIDYARCLVDWSYEDLEEAIARGQLAPGRLAATSLWECVAPDAELDEPAFIDAVSRNLRLGRVLLLVMGDGIREGAESLAGYLQVHAGLHFTLGLVEMATFELPAGGGYLVQPRVLARTLNVERGIVRVDGPGIRVGAPERIDRRPRATSISEETFYERLAEVEPSLPARLRAFVRSLEPLGVFPELKRTLILRWKASDDVAINLGYVTTSGEVWTDAVTWNLGALGIPNAARDFLETLAALVGGQVTLRGARDPYVAREGRPPKLGMLLDRSDAWRDAIGDFIRDLRTALAAVQREDVAGPS